MGPNGGLGSGVLPASGFTPDFRVMFLGASCLLDSLFMQHWNTDELSIRHVEAC